VNLTSERQQKLNELFRINRRIEKAYLLKESLEGLWTQGNEKAMRSYLYRWTRELRWQRLPALDKLASLLIGHEEGIANYYRVPVRFGVVEAINGNLRALMKRGRGYSNLRYLLLKAQRINATQIEFVAFAKAA
jgi:transposase